MFYVPNEILCIPFCSFQVNLFIFFAVLVGSKSCIMYYFPILIYQVIKKVLHKSDFILDLLINLFSQKDTECFMVGKNVTDQEVVGLGWIVGTVAGFRKNEMNLWSLRLLTNSQVCLNIQGNVWNVNVVNGQLWVCLRWTHTIDL